MPDFTWPDPFERGKTYRVRISFDAPRDHFDQGEVLEYQYPASSRYDSMVGYFFTDTKGRWRSWDMSFDEAEKTIASWSDYFEAGHGSA